MRTYEGDQPIVLEGEQADALFTVLEGVAEVRLGRSATPIAGLKAGDCFGETALLRHSTRTASVIALTPCTVLRIEASVIGAVLERSPGFGRALERTSDELEKARFIREVAAFAALDDTGRRELARSTQDRTIAEGTTLFCEEEMGTACYLVRTGRVRLVRTVGGSPSTVAMLGAGSLFGETAVLTGEPRNATALADTDVDLLELPRSALDDVVFANRDVARGLRELVRLRHRPTRTEGVELHRTDPPEGETVAVLKDPIAHRYFRLSEHGLFVWERLDGNSNVRDLALEGMERFHSFAPDAIAQLLLRLEAGGFIRGAGLRQEPQDEAQAWPRRAIARVYAAFTWTKEIPALHRITDAVYRFGARALFTPVAQVLLVLVALAGPVALGVSSERTQEAVGSVGGVGWALFVGFVLAAMIHDSGHALATRHYGRQVRGGIGFFWLSPIVFVNTSDMWLAPKRQRVVVTLAGPYAHLIAAGVAGLATLVLEGFWLVALWELALFSYFDVLLNLSPLLELDGYYLLVHLLHRPNLRRRSLAFLVEGWPRVLRDRTVLHGHGLEAAYGIASVLFVVVLMAYSIFFYRAGIEPWLARVFSPGTTTAIGWGLVVALVVATVTAVLGDIQRAVAVSRGERTTESLDRSA
ncbi:MAG: cyclic nucleotide-binding domain-containing protein [Gaiellaceae bacterium]